MLQLQHQYKTRDRQTHIFPARGLAVYRGQIYNAPVYWKNTASYCSPVLKLENDDFERIDPHNVRTGSVLAGQAELHISLEPWVRIHSTGDKARVIRMKPFARYAAWTDKAAATVFESLVMALHPRLGHASPARVLDINLVTMICQTVDFDMGWVLLWCHD